MATGKVVRFDEVRGYGFIAPDNGNEDVFMHANDLLDEKYLFRPGLRVTFEMEDGGRGLKASDVRIDQPSGLAPAGRPTVAVAKQSRSVDEADDGVCDLLPAAEFQQEVTETLLRTAPTLTAEQILQVRKAIGELAHGHRWVES